MRKIISMVFLKRYTLDYETSINIACQIKLTKVGCYSGSAPRELDWINRRPFCEELMTASGEMLKLATLRQCSHHRCSDVDASLVDLDPRVSLVITMLDTNTRKQPFQSRLASSNGKLDPPPPPRPPSPSSSIGPLLSSYAYCSPFTTHKSHDCAMQTSKQDLGKQPSKMCMRTPQTKVACCNRRSLIGKSISSTKRLHTWRRPSPQLDHAPCDRVAEQTQGAAHEAENHRVRCENAPFAAIQHHVSAQPGRFAI